MPFCSKLKERESPGSSVVSESKPSMELFSGWGSAAGWWERVSLLVQVSWVPSLMVMVDGLRPFLVMDTEAVAGAVILGVLAPSLKKVW